MKEEVKVSHNVTRLSIYSIFAYCLSHNVSPEGLTEGHLARSVYNTGKTNSVNKKFVHPHIYHLKKNGVISVVGKRLCPITGKLCESYNLSGKLFMITIQDDKKRENYYISHNFQQDSSKWTADRLDKNIRTFFNLKTAEEVIKDLIELHGDEREDYLIIEV
jgi:hypothetical protein